MRVALETNVIVSAVATRGLCADLFNLVLSEHELVVGETVIAELRKVLRQKLRIPGEAIDELETLLRQEGTVVAKAVALPLAIRDKSDLVVLSEAVAGNAEVLVTGDRDLLDIETALPLNILTPRAFWERVRNNAASSLSPASPASTPPSGSSSGSR